MPPPEEPWNPFDADSQRERFPDVREALRHHSSYSSDDGGDDGDDTPPAARPVVDIERLSAAGHSVAIDEGQKPPSLGRIPPETSQLLEACCQAWFDAQAALKAERVS
jgi:hypothetical protein